MRAGGIDTIVYVEGTAGRGSASRWTTVLAMLIYTLTLPRGLSFSKVSWRRWSFSSSIVDERG